MKKSVLLWLSCSISLCVSSTFAQTRVSSDGTDFIFALLPVGNNQATYNYQSSYWRIQVSGYDTGAVSVYSFDPQGNEILQWTSAYGSGTPAMQQLNTYSAQAGAPPSFSGFHLTSTSPVSVQLYSEGDDNGELYLLLPTIGLGTSYVAESYANVPGQPLQINPKVWNALPGRSIVLLTAAYDSTHVQIIPSCRTVDGLSSGSTRNIVLERGQTYLMEADTFASEDISGTTITSDRPVAVFSGNNNPLLPDLSSYSLTVPGDNYRNPIAEGMLPLWSWDSTGYVSIPFYPVSTNATTPGGDGDFYQCFGMSPISATITDGSTNWTNSAQNVILPISIQDRKPFSAIQYDYFTGNDTKNGLETFTSPDASVLIPTSAWKNAYAWVVPRNSEYRGAQYVNVIARTARVNSIKFLKDGKAIKVSPIATYSVPQFPNLTGITLELAPGLYQAFGDSNFIVYSYGHTTGEYKGGYGYAAPCGLMLNVPNNIPPIFSVDTFCHSWIVHIHETRPDYLRIHSVLMYSDSATASKLGLNVSFNISPIQKFPSLKDTDETFEVDVADPTKPASGFLYFTDGEGKMYALDLRYLGATFFPQFSPSSFSGRVITPSDTCITIHVWNAYSTRSIPVDRIGLDSSSSFSLDTVGLGLPKMLAPHDTITVRVCASVSDHDTIHVDTLAIDAGCLFHIPLAITGLLPRVNWDRDSATDTLLCGSPDTVRITLQNNSANHTEEVIDSIVIQGADATEFSFAGNQFDYPQLVNFPLDYGETVWIDVAFTPDMSKPVPTRWNDRHAEVIAYNELHSNPIVQLTARVTYGQIAIDRPEVDFGTIPIQTSKTSTIHVTNTGTAPVTVSKILIGDTEVTLSGLSIGDPISPGQSIPVTLTATAASLDSETVLVQIWTSSVCTSPDTLLVTFYAAGKPHGVQSQIVPAAIPPIYTCGRSSGAVTITNFGPDTMHVLSLHIAGSGINPDSTFFTLANGTQTEALDSKLAVDSMLAIPLSYHPTQEGFHSAVLEITWDSLGTTVVSSVVVNGVSSTLHTTLSASMTGVDTNYSGIISNVLRVPIVLDSALDAAAQVYRLPVSISFDRDLFEYEGIVPLPGLFISDSNVSDNVNKTTVSVTLSATQPIRIAGQLCTLKLLPVVAQTNTSELSLAAPFGIDSTGDTLCLASAIHPATIVVGDSCGDRLLREAMNMEPIVISGIVPQPAADNLTIRMNVLSPMTMRLTLSDALGRTSLEQSTAAAPGTNSYLLQIGQLPPGYYELTVAGEGCIVRKRILIER